MAARSPFSCLVLIVGGMMLALSPATAGSKWGKKPPDYCPILDGVSDPMYQFGLAYVPSSRFEGYGRSSLIELDAYGEFAYLRQILYGDVDLKLRARDTWFTSPAHLDLPRQLLKLAVDAGWAGRFRDGLAVQVRAAPGFYSDAKELDRNSVFVPTSCTLIRTFTPEMAGIVGLEVRLGFEELVIPILGLHFEIGDDVVVSMAVPESKAVWFINRDWTTRAGVNWGNTSYRLHDHRELVTIEDYRVFWQLTHRQTDQLEFVGEIGYLFNRRMEFDEDPSGDIEIGDAPFVRFAIGRPL